MQIYRCDNCKKVIKRLLDVYTLHHNVACLEVCPSCMKPILELTNDKKLLRTKLIKELQADPLKSG